MSEQSDKQSNRDSWWKSTGLFEEGVYYLHEMEHQEFEKLYLNIREKEERILSDLLVAKLPETPAGFSHAKEWALRAKSAKRLKKYLSLKKEIGSVLDLACGNGWLLNYLATEIDAKLIGLDVNRPELEQAARLAVSDEQVYLYGSIFRKELIPRNSFDIIIVSAAIQYFDGLKDLIDLLRSYLTATGEIHILDSPFYGNDEVRAASERSGDYYSSNGIAEMQEFYHHHRSSALMELAAEIMYQPGIRSKLPFWKENPFPWYRLKKKLDQ